MLHDVRIAKALRKQDMEHRNVSWILDQDGEEEHWIEMIRETRGQNFVVDCELTIKVFDNNGNFEKCFRFQVLLADNKIIRNSLKDRGCLEYIPYMVFMLIIYISMAETCLRHKLFITKDRLCSVAFLCQL